MLYCPNCSALLEDPNAPICPKCGFDREAAREEEEKYRKESMAKELEEIEVKPPVLPEIPEDAPKCPTCMSPIKNIPDKQLSFELMGKDVTIHNVRIMGMNLHKRAITQCIVTFDSWECENKHKFFSRFTSSYKELCPICRDSMKKFGSEIRSCTHCQLNIPGNCYLRMEGRTLLEEEGWIYKPELAEG
ncbi:MAG: hypothetical protein JSV49_00360 [Thermoplasmata archaeon]|nr:MAG: hypothetical protein JSV49_00360 [Thermoplasmata archaeon]